MLVPGLLFGVVLSWNIWFWAAVLLNSFLFASLAVALAMLVKSHADQSLVTSFVIPPMAFLGVIFFPVENFPAWAQKAIFLLPLTHASTSIRTASFGNMPSMMSFLRLDYFSDVDSPSLRNRPGNEQILW
nr:ABC transporter permease [Desulfocicer vacuolatum]